MVSVGKLHYKGSAKDIYEVPGDPNSIFFRWKNTWSAFDVGAHPQEIPGKGLAICRQAVRSFEIAQALGVPTHFIEQADELTIRVRKLDVHGTDTMTTSDKCYVAPIEMIGRFRNAGSLDRKFRSGKAKPVDYGFPTNDPPPVGAPLPWPIKHLTTKFEETDRDITQAEAITMAGLSEDDLDQFWLMVMRLFAGVGLVYAQAGYTHLDGKMEVGFGPNREKMVVDVLGTTDEDRPVDAEALAQGKVEHFSKELMRQMLIDSGYYKELQAARDAGKPDPPYHRLSDEQIELCSNRFTQFADDYCAVNLSTELVV